MPPAAGGTRSPQTPRFYFALARGASITQDLQGRFGLAEARREGNGRDYFWHFGQNTLVRPATTSDCNFPPHFTHFSPALP